MERKITTKHNVGDRVIYAQATKLQFMKVSSIVVSVGELCSVQYRCISLHTGREFFVHEENVYGEEDMDINLRVPLYGAAG